MTPLVPFLRKRPQCELIFYQTPEKSGGEIPSASAAERASFSGFSLLHTAESTRRQNFIGSQTSWVPLLTKPLALLQFLPCFLWFLSMSLIKKLVPYPALPWIPGTYPPKNSFHTSKPRTDKNVCFSIPSDWCDWVRRLYKFYSKGRCSKSPAAAGWKWTFLQHLWQPWCLLL